MKNKPEIHQPMIDLYFKYNGDEDVLARMGSPEEKMWVSEGAWALLRDFVHHLHLTKGKLAAHTFSKSMAAEYKQYFANEATLIYFLQKLRNTM